MITIDDLLIDVFRKGREIARTMLTGRVAIRRHQLGVILKVKPQQFAAEQPFSVASGELA